MRSDGFFSLPFLLQCERTRLGLSRAGMIRRGEPSASLRHPIWKLFPGANSRQEFLYGIISQKSRPSYFSSQVPANHAACLNQEMIRSYRRPTWQPQVLLTPIEETKHSFALLSSASLSRSGWVLNEHDPPHKLRVGCMDTRQGNTALCATPRAPRRCYCWTFWTKSD